nr:hypothetical protein [Mycobacterium sp. E2479]
MPDVTAHHGIFKDTYLHVDDTGGAGSPRSDKPLTGYTYENLTKDLHSLIEPLELRDITLSDRHDRRPVGPRGAGAEQHVEQPPNVHKRGGEHTK